MSDRVTPPRAGALADRLPVAAGAMAARLRSADQPLGDFAGHEGCHESRNVIGPGVVRQVRRGSREVGAHAVETNTFGVDRADPVERGKAEKIFGLSRRGAELAREAADDDHGRSWPARSGPVPSHPPAITLRTLHFEAFTSNG
ncbi:hypothetical protein ADK67_12700 [Saccharothrix sp. NRRL B-16348]|uniref:homocysteine S-methyltransferase family protein n=1 Tax=Saccharothrix sp. NRRL B-16348 TaxID=1415542 RepID=UPI0006AE9DAD|nr:homocysteine S-methyltransferase family protein [Saccharothrix sp. NRRL B-16348]KOX27959.1 hypothetical protein ADK67_12700 [Saccharothrix sp. NRRL B-16348]